MQDKDKQTGSSGDNAVHDFFIESFCKEMLIRPEQASSLLNSDKYLRHIITNGIKDNFDPIVRWIQHVFTGNERLILLLVSAF